MRRRVLSIICNPGCRVVSGLSDEQHAALHRLRHATAPLDAGAARVLYAVAHPRGTLTEGDAADPATAVALQQRGIIRRRPRAGYLELTTTPGSPSCRSDPRH